MATDQSTTKTNKLKLTDRFIQSLKAAPPGKRLSYWDEVGGLALRVTDKGARSFSVVRRRPGHLKPDRVTLGSYPDMSLKEAREKALEVRSDLAKGINPKEEAKRKRREADEAKRMEERKRKDLFELVAEQFIKKHVATLRNSKDIENLVRRDLMSAWRGRLIGEIRRRDVVELIEGIIERPDRRKKGGVSYSAHHALAYAKKLFSWAVARDFIEASPADRVSAKGLIGAKQPRTRVLTDAEIRLLWKVTADLEYPLGPFVRLLLVLGQRLREVAWAEWREFGLDKALWVIPSERMKTKVTHEVPLPPLAVDILESLPRFQDGRFLFSTTGGKSPVQSFSKLKAKLNQAITRHVLDEGGDGIGPFVFHDARRTMRTRLSALPIPDEVKELMIAHARPSLHKVYDQHSFQDEKRRGFELWANALMAIVEPPANVVPLVRTG